MVVVVVVWGPRRPEDSLCDGSQANPPELDQAEDLASLVSVNESSVLNTLLQRYQAQLPHTHAGPDLIFLQPQGLMAQHAHFTESLSLLHLHLFKERSRLTVSASFFLTLTLSLFIIPQKGFLPESPVISVMTSSGYCFFVVSCDSQCPWASVIPPPPLSYTFFPN